MCDPITLTVGAIYLGGKEVAKTLSPDLPKYTPPAPASSTVGEPLKNVDEEQRRAALTQRKAAALAAGMAGTVKTSPLGVTGAGKTTLG